MIIDGQGVRLFTARSLSALFVQALEWVSGGRLICRGCGMRIHPQFVADFTTDGCRLCDARKLRLEGAARYRPWLLLMAFGGALVAMILFAVAVPVGVDYPIFAGAARAWLAGESQLYDGGALGFFYAPWALLIFAPLSYLPDPAGSLLINLLSVIGIVLSTKILTGKARWWVLLMAIFGNIATINLLASAQWDALILTAVALGYVAIENGQPWGLGLALAFIGTKPTNAIIPALVLAALAVRRWGWQAWRALVIPAVALAVSFPIAGWDWPIRYWSFIEASPPDAGYNMADLYNLDLVRQLMTLSAWVLTVLAVLRAVRHGADRAALMGSLLLNLLMSPYVTIYHFVTTIPLAVHAAKRDTLWLAGLWLASMIWMMIQPFTPLYPLALAVAAFFTLKPEAEVQHER